MWLQQRNCGGSLMRKTPLHLDGTCMMQRLVTVCFTLLIVCCATTGLRAEPTLYGVTIELRSESEDSRGDILSDAKRIRIINLGPVINHSGLDYGPTISADGKTLYYVSDRRGGRITRDGDFSHDFWAARKDNNLDTTFYPPYNIDTVDAGVNSVFNEGVASIAADRQTLFFTGCNRPDGLGDCDIYVAEIEGDRWGKPRNLGRNVNSEFWDTQPSISPDKSRLYFVSNRPSPTSEDGGGADDSDIWFCEWDDDLGEWKPAQNLGPDINTERREESPFIAADGNTLFFASNGHLPNMGGLDFYKTQKTGEKDRSKRDRWAKPSQLPAPINTAEDEQFISLPASGDVLYFSSRRRDLPGAQGNLDIFMAFIPTYFRAVNLIVDVIDECTNQPIPATVAFRNSKTAKESSLSVDDAQRQASIIVTNADYGMGEAKDTKVNYTVVASSPAYGERSITVEVEDPGQTTNSDESKVATEIRKTITLGQRPVITAEMEFSDYVKKKNGTFKGLVLEERATRQLFPLLNYVFFDEDKGTLPARYVLFKNASQTAGFSDERIPGGTFEKYYTVLNIYGYRMLKFPNVKVDIVGCLDEVNEDKNSTLSKDRAKVVYDYLRNIWNIPAERMKMQSRGYPELRSNIKDTFGVVENRRTELRFNGPEEEVWQVMKPILDNDPTVYPSPDKLTFGMRNGIDNSLVKSRRIEVTRNATKWKTLTDVGTTDASKDWDWQNDDSEFPKEKVETTVKEAQIAPYEATLIVTAQNGAECKSDPIKIPVLRVSSIGRTVEITGEKTLEKYNLILFPFDSPVAGPLNERILNEYVFGRVKSSSDIKVEGHTDVVGLDTRNKKLSEDRASTVERGIRAKTNKFASLEARGTGEEEELYTNLLPEGRFFNRTVQVKIETPLQDAELE
jgi:outer membrane protein OmpA-like peptidoglycan-associated protein